MTVPRIAVIGGGPAGLSAALQLKRYEFAPELFEAHEPGGLLRNANLVENYPGFPGGISGPALVARMVSQAEETGVLIRRERVSRLDWTGEEFTLESTVGTRLTVDIAVLATGTRPLSLPGGLVTNNALPLVHHEVVGLRDKRDADIAVIGAGDAAFDYALQLAAHNRVRIHMRSDRVRALPLLIERAVLHPDITIVEHSELTEARAHPDGGIHLSWCTGGSAEADRADALLVAIGREADWRCCTPELLAEQDRLRETGRLAIIGDLGNGRQRQATIAVADGIRAAMSIWSQWSRQG